MIPTVLRCANCLKQFIVVDSNIATYGPALNTFSAWELFSITHNDIFQIRFWLNFIFPQVKSLDKVVITTPGCNMNSYGEIPGVVGYKGASLKIVKRVCDNDRQVF